MIARVTRSVNRGDEALILLLYNTLIHKLRFLQDKKAQFVNVMGIMRKTYGY